MAALGLFVLIGLVVVVILIILLSLLLAGGKKHYTDEQPSVLDEMRRYTELRDRGIISDEEFEKMKEKVLNINQK